jgi:CheY-like chemotaxis protein
MPSTHPDNRSILIAEGDRRVRQLQSHFLGVAGFVVEFADDGMLALDRAREGQPALVVTEILIPKLDGLSLCRRLREDPVTREIPVLVFSILAAEERAGEAGASAFLRKPLVDSIFVASVHDLVAARAPHAREEQWASR